MKMLILILTMTFKTTAFAESIEKEFKLKYNLKKNDGCFNIPKDIQRLLAPIDEVDATTQKLCLIKNKKAEDLGLLFFNVTRIECHACGPEFWIYKRDSRPSLFRISKDYGEHGKPAEVAEVFSILDRNFFIFKSNFLAQGVTESSLSVYEFNSKTNRLSEIFNSFLSGTNFEGMTPSCSGWDTKYTIDLDKKEIKFLKEGRECDLIATKLDELDNHRNGKKIFSEKYLSLIEKH